MIFQIMQNGLSVWQNLILLVTILVTILGSMTLHELAPGLVSYMQGDPTAKKAGRLTLNPIKHINSIGLICMLFCGFGWARAVPVDPRYYKNGVGTAYQSDNRHKHNCFTCYAYLALANGNVRRLSDTEVYDGSGV